MELNQLAEEEREKLKVIRNGDKMYVLFVRS